MDLHLQLLSKSAALNISSKIKGRPTENRVLLAIPNGEKTTKSGLFVPTTVEEGVPRKGVIVGFGDISEEYKRQASFLEVGTIVTYGLYAGKSVNINIPGLENINQDFTVLSLNEIIFIEPNND